MSAHAAHLLMFFVFGLIVAFKFYYLVRRLWNLPLEHGPGYFLSTAVAPDFYGGPGMRWLRWYRGLALAECLIFVTLVAAFVVSGHLDEMPVLAPIDVALYFLMVVGFMLWARRRLPVAPPTRLAAVAIALAPRRLGDYISWRMEIVMAALVAGSWVLIARTGDWRALIIGTYIVVGLVPLKVLAVRSNFPLPPERAEEHHQWLEAARRYGLRTIDLMRWLFLVVLVGYAVMHGWPSAKGLVWLRWAFVAAGLGVWLAMVNVTVRDGRRVAAMGRDLRPPGSWRGPFGDAKPACAGGRIFNIAYFGGLVLLIVWLGR